MKERALVSLLVLAATVLSGCASAPPAATAPPAAVEGTALSLACAPDARRIAFPSIGLPLQSRVLDIALTPERVWLLVDPHFVIEVGRSPEKPTYRTLSGSEDAIWNALDVDPRDGSLWIVSQRRIELIHLGPDGKTRTVRIPRLEGEGGFQEVLLDEEAVYVVPTCAESALWKLGRDGGVLAQEFRRESGEPLTSRTDFTPEEGQGSLEGCIPVALARDLAGRVTVFDGVTRTFYRAEAGGWIPVLEIPDPELDPGGVRVDRPGTEEETWTLVRRTPGYFFLGDEPVFQPWIDLEGSKPGQVLLRYLRPGTGGMNMAFERCQGQPWFGSAPIASDAHGYATVIDNHLVLGAWPEAQAP